MLFHSSSKFSNPSYRGIEYGMMSSGARNLCNLGSLTPGESARPPITGISPYKPVNFVHKYVIPLTNVLRNDSLIKPDPLISAIFVDCFRLCPRMKMDLPMFLWQWMCISNIVFCAHLKASKQMKSLIAPKISSF
jgi:hypothetical protein